MTLKCETKKKTRQKEKSLPEIDIEAPYSRILNHLKDENRLRQLSEIEVSAKNPDLLSNDYLGLGRDAHLFREEFNERFADASFTSSASRLLSSSNKYHLQLEQLLASLYGREALIFNSGYHANIGILQALALPGTLFIADKLAHASIIDGMRLSGEDFKRFPHNSINKLRRIIKASYDEYERIIVISEAIFSMDGDLAPMMELIRIKKEFPKVMLYIDEAHSFGVRGDKGLGLAEEYGLIKEVDILIGTLGKAAASMGAFAIVSSVMKQFLVNTARSLIFSTAISPAQTAWSILMIEKIVAGADRRRQLKEISHELLKQLSNRINVETVSESQIVPIIIGEAGEAINMAAYLSRNGFDVRAIRKPTVPAGSERIRLSLNANLTKKDITRLVEIIGKYH